MAEQANASGVAVVTGAAGGMGKATVRALFNAGWNELILSDLNEDALEAVAKPLREEGAVVSLYPGDVSDPGYPAGLVEALKGRPIAAIVHMAGLGPHQTGAEPMRIIEVNFGGTTRLVDAIRGQMAPDAAAVLIGSNSTYFSPKMKAEAVEAFRQPLQPNGEVELARIAPTPEEAYPLSKIGVLALVRREARSFGQNTGARLVSLSPGTTDTNMFRTSKQDSSAGVIEQLLEVAAVKRVAQPEEIASVAAFLCSSAAGMIAGTDILVDGGQVAGLGF